MMRADLLSHPLEGRGGGMGIPFVPFTFPTVSFCRLAKEMGYTIGWGECDDIWALYRDGRKSGEIPVSPEGWTSTSEAREYLVRKGVDELLARKWLAVADEAAERWWGQGDYFVGFGGEPGLFGAVSGLFQGAGELVGGTVGKLTSGIVSGVAAGLKLPKWLIWAVFFLLLALILWAGWKYIGGGR